MPDAGIPSFTRNIEDDRKRSYIPPCRIVWTTEGKLAPVATETLVNACEIQPYLHANPPCCLLKPGAAILLDYGRELHGGIRIVTGRSEGKGGRNRVRVRFGESASEAMNEPNNDHSNHDSVIDLPPLGATEFGSTGFRFVRLDVPAATGSDIVLLGVPAVSLLRDLKYVGSFTSNDERLNAIWRTGAYTVHLNMQDYLYDGIKRDRLVWMGDMHPEIRVVAAVFDDTALVEKSMDFIRDRTPVELPMNGISSYTCWWVICQHDWHMARGRMDYLRSQRESLIAALRQMASWVDDAGRENMPAWRFLDWPSANDKAAVCAGLQGLLAWTLDCGERLCHFLSEPETADLCATTRDKLRSHAAGRVGNKSAAAMRVLGGVGDAEKLHREILSMNPLSGISSFYGYYVLQARALMGDITGSMDLIRRYWGGMLDVGATTFWEDFNLDWKVNASRIDELPRKGQKDIHADYGDHCYKGLRHSLCHGWAGGPTAWLSEHVLGLRIREPGMTSVALSPNLGDLEWVEGSVPTPHGPIHCRITKDRDGVVKCEHDAPPSVKVSTSTSTTQASR